MVLPAIAMGHPSQLYADPSDVIVDANLNLRQKLAVLERWRTETLTLPPNDAEGAAGGARNRLREILRAKQALLDGNASVMETVFRSAEADKFEAAPANTESLASARRRRSDWRR